jgi:hypothetical protein
MGRSGSRTWSSRVAVLAAGIALALTGATPASAGGGEVGTPQPELMHFNIGPSGGHGTGAVLPNGDIVFAIPSQSGKSIHVCTIFPGARACSHIVTLDAYKSGGSQDTFSGTVEVLAPSAHDLVIAAEDCCHLTVGGADGGAVVFESSDGGATFAAELPAGTIKSIGAATYAEGTLMVGSTLASAVNVQALRQNVFESVDMSMATPVVGADGDTSLTTYEGGVIVASDDTTNAHVEYATSIFNSSGSYASVGSFPNELVTAVSGNALLTDPGGSLTGGERLRFFNGTSFGPVHKVPDPPQGDDGYFTMQETGRVVHVFFIDRRASYNAFEESTTDGVHWSGFEEFTLGSAIASNGLSPALGPSGAGLLLECNGSPLYAQPVLNAQLVHVALAATHVQVGHTTALRGTSSPRLTNQAVTLQRFDAGKWYPVSVGHESATGSFTFTVPAVTRTYRAVVNEKRGYDQYGYSNDVTLVAVA